ncbi:hypothetical protein [Phenylobacterium sp.]|uniref:hypothetical protein n=1 Tax=Phenylobacterium sp. TaxID=1871053 RepID=UPI00286C2E92|nr:hypothetical protein [Phenylobacterium sp.]
MRAQDYFVPSWTEDVGALLASGARVDLLCDARGCPGVTGVDLHQMSGWFGPRYSLWNRRPACPACASPGRYRAQPPGAWQKLLYDAPAGLVEPLHQRWYATLEPDLRDRLPVKPMLAAIDGCLLVGCGVCEARFFVAAVMVGAWGPEVCVIALEHAMGCGQVACELAVDIAPLAAVPMSERP